MKFLKSTDNMLTYKYYANPANSENVQVMVYERSDDEFQNVVDEYYENPERANGIFPRKTLVHYFKKKHKIKMEYSIVKDSSGYVGLEITIVNNEDNIDLSEYILCIESKRKCQKSEGVSKNNALLFNLPIQYTHNTNSVNAFYICNPQVRKKYMLYICPTRKYIRRADKLIRSKNTDDFTCELQIRPTLRHYLMFEHGEAVFNPHFNIFTNQAYITLKCKIYDFINFNTTNLEPMPSELNV